jgi:hypothetical protein
LHAARARRRRAQLHSITRERDETARTRFMLRAFQHRWDQFCWTDESAVVRGRGAPPRHARRLGTALTLPRRTARARRRTGARTSACTGARFRGNARARAPFSCAASASLSCRSCPPLAC